MIGVATMAAFAAGVKIDSFAYSPAQDFANGFATFVAQNTGAGKPERVKQGIREAALLSLSFCAVVSALVFIFARPLLTLFIDPGEREILAVGVHYLRVEGVFYVGIGLLFLLYAIYRGLERAGMSVVLTVISLGLRVALAYAFASQWNNIPVQILDGLAAGAMGVATPLLVQRYTRGSGRFNTALGFVMTLQGVGAALSPGIANVIVGAQGRFGLAFMCLAGAALLALPAFWLAQRGAPSDAPASPAAPLAPGTTPHT